MNKSLIHWESGNGKGKAKMGLPLFAMGDVATKRGCGRWILLMIDG